MSLSVNDLRILAHLSAHPNSSAVEVARALGLNVFSTISDLHLLESKKLATVTQQKDPKRWSIGKKGNLAATSHKADAGSSASTGVLLREGQRRGEGFSGVSELIPAEQRGWQGPPVQRTHCRVCDLPLSSKDRNIMGYLRDHPGSHQKEVATALGLNHDVVKRKLYDFKARGEVIVTRDGGPRRWSLKPDLPQRTGGQISPHQVQVSFPVPGSESGRTRSDEAVSSPSGPPARVEPGQARVGRSGVLASEPSGKSAREALHGEPRVTAPAPMQAGVPVLPADWRPPPAEGPRLIEHLPQPLRRFIDWPVS